MRSSSRTNVSRPRARHAPELDDEANHRVAAARTAELIRLMHAVVRKIPRGKVLTYGQLAELAGLPGGARVAGAAMKSSKGLPWQRVMGRAGPRRGKIAIHDPVGAALQRELLAREGVAVSERGTVDLALFGWLDPAAGTPKRARRVTARRGAARRRA